MSVYHKVFFLGYLVVFGGVLDHFDFHGVSVEGGCVGQDFSGVRVHPLDGGNVPFSHKQQPTDLLQSQTSEKSDENFNRYKTGYIIFYQI